MHTLGAARSDKGCESTQSEATDFQKAWSLATMGFAAEWAKHSRCLGRSRLPPRAPFPFYFESRFLRNRGLRASASTVKDSESG
jgi:hypothetical protein